MPEEEKNELEDFLKEEEEEKPEETEEGEIQQAAAEVPPVSEWEKMSEEERKAAYEVWQLMQNPQVSMAFYATLQGLQQGQVPTTQPTTPQPLEEEEEYLESKVWEKPIEVMQKVAEKQVIQVIQAIAPLLQASVENRLSNEIEKFKSEVREVFGEDIPEAETKFKQKLAALTPDQALNPQNLQYLKTMVIGELTMEKKAGKISNRTVKRTPLSAGVSAPAVGETETVYVPSWVRELGTRLGLNEDRIKKVWQEIKSKK
jgi:GTPase SAR1 family protein